MAKSTKFTGYKWSGLDDVPEGTEGHGRVKTFIESIDWDALCQYASKLRNGESCTVDPDIDMGGVHMIRIITFSDGTRWIARLRTRFFDDDDDEKDVALVSFMEQQELDCIQLVRERTNVPVPVVYGYKVHPENAVGASFMLMECLPGNTAMNIDPDIPPQYKASFHADMARFQTAISSIQFPKIGSIIRLEDGAYDIGPIPKLGGPFNTATEYLIAWAENVKFGCPMEGMLAICGDASDEIATHIRDFTFRLKSLAASIPTRNHGPFPLCHIDYGHHNVIVDDNYDVLGVIDWEHACTLPWEAVDFPMTLSITPASMAAPTLFDDNGVHKDAIVRETISDRKRYVEMVRQVEQSKGMPPLLSAVLEDEAGQDLAAAMRTYVQDGKFGWYCKIFDAHHERWANNHDEYGASIPNDNRKEQGEDTVKHPSSLWGILAA